MAIGIGKRVEEALGKLVAGDPEGALLPACVAVGATARKVYPLPCKDEPAYKNFLADNMQLIILVCTDGVLTCGGISLEVPWAPTKTGNVHLGLDEILYRLVRCNMIHEGELPPKIVFTNEIKFGAGDPITLPWKIIEGMIMAVVGSSSNAGDHHATGFNWHGKPVADFWGKKNAILAALTKP